MSKRPYSGAYTHQRSNKVCGHCHSRKIRCDIAEKGSPCTNCASYGSACILRRRKNQRQDSSDEGHQASPTRTQLADAGSHLTTRSSHDTAQSVSDAAWARPEEWTPGVPPTLQALADLPSAGLSWEQGNGEQLEASIAALNDYSHLADFEDIFWYTSNSHGPRSPDARASIVTTEPSHRQPALLPDPSGVLSNSPAPVREQDRDFLRSQGCFELPPHPLLWQLMQLYFRWVHPHLPVLAENEVWSRWRDGEFHAHSFSLLLVRAMVFAAAGYADLPFLSSMGFGSKREARSAFYRQAKLLFDFGLEQDVVRNAQACLLLTYHSPSYSRMRVNSSWLAHAVRFARIARADSCFILTEEDPKRVQLLKRIWWCVLFRDRILSLGLRRSLLVHVDPDSYWQSEDSILQSADFSSELGNSTVYDMETQLGIIKVLGVMCRLMHCLLRPLDILYRIEGVDERLPAIAGPQLAPTVAATKNAQDCLNAWHDETIAQFPFPVSLGVDDVPEAICLYVNILFCYHAVAVFSLNAYLALVHEIFPASRDMLCIEDVRESLETSNGDISRRTQEILQMRLVKYLPISATPLIAPSLILQAINVTAARSQNPGSEAVEARKLDVFTRTLKSQQERFEGCDYCWDVMNNIISYVRDDEGLLDSMASWRDARVMAESSREGQGNEGTSKKRKIKLDWTTLVSKRPRLFLRLMMHLNYALCTGGPPQEGDFISVLAKDAV